MAKKNKRRTQVESVHEEGNQVGDWVSGLHPGEWGLSGAQVDQNGGWQNAPAHDADVQPGDSVSNASSYVDTNTDWQPAAPTPPSKDIPMQAPTNGWGWSGAPPGSPALQGQNQGTYDPTPLMGMHSMLSTIAEQRQAQHRELTEQLRQQHQRAQNMAYGHQKPARHRREGSANWGQTAGQTSDVGTLRSNHAAGESNLGGAWGSAWNNEQTGKGNNWAGTGEGSAMTTKSKKKLSKSEGQQTNANTNGGWGAPSGESSWGATGGWDSAGTGNASTSVAPGGFGSTGAGLGGWGPATGEGGWGTEETSAPGLTQSNSWGAWADPQQEAKKGKTPKSGISGFFSRIFGGRGKEKKDKGKKKEMEADLWAEETKGKRKTKGKEKNVQIQEQGKKGKTLKKQKFAEPEVTTWATPEDEYDDDDIGDDYNNQNDNSWGNTGTQGGWHADSGKGWADSTPAAAPKASEVWSNSPHTKTSRAYAFATEGPMPEKRRSRSDGHNAEYPIVESGEDALVPARRALFSTERLSRDRILWFFDPNKDPRVSAMLGWIQRMQVPLVLFGFSKFLETKERGALFTNVDYRSPSASHEPAFHWLTFDKIQPTMDRTLQESLAFYDPASQILVFVFLLSESKRSMAIWRRKLPLPENIRQTYGTHITKLVSSLNKQYPIHVDEMPTSTPTLTNNLSRDESNRKKWHSWGRT